MTDDIQNDLEEAGPLPTYQVDEISLETYAFCLMAGLYRDTDTLYEYLDAAEGIADRETLKVVWRVLDVYVDITTD